jgi:hypothetical protein
VHFQKMPLIEANSDAQVHTLRGQYLFGVPLDVCLIGCMPD